ncbi:hypothetical protein RclHR1_01420030 [Rhizophagus clarus]|uniref:MARVEL domain-containing protein n=1 Tax=Rhizophagus clarus TaxID=94130 RepID=A0A2Z6QBZ5_9GLOM|nr:hypothetical protein RclHR1_01420030 [Rhizophagus clarus]GES95087.1 hypothetical protein GLOIN_2v1761388 [Rhizophagus clarus]
MRLFISIARTLLLAFSLVCLTLDAGSIRIIDSLYSTYSSYSSYSSTYINLDESLFKIRSILAFSMFNDLLSFLVSAYYIVMIEKKWNQVPATYDIIICGVELVLWVIYAGLQFQYKELILTSVYSILIIILYSALGAVLFNHRRNLAHSGENPTPLSRDSGTNNTTNNATNNTTIEVHQT